MPDYPLRVRVLSRTGSCVAQLRSADLPEPPACAQKLACERVLITGECHYFDFLAERNRLECQLLPYGEEHVLQLLGLAHSLAVARPTARPIGVYQADETGRVVSQSSSVWQVLDAPDEHPMPDFGLVHPDDRQRILTEWDEAVRGQAHFLGEHRFLGPRGRSGVVRSEAFPLFGPGGELTGWIGTLCEISADERNLSTLAETNRQLQQALRSKDEFLASMSHELRSPLHSVLTMLEALREELYGPTSQRQNEGLARAEESCRHLLSLINDILDLSRSTAGKLDLNIRPQPAEELCLASLRMVRETAYKKRLNLTTWIDPQVGLLRVDGRRFKQILVNLLSNAVKFTPEGGTVGLDMLGDPQARRAEITVWDTGIGIEPAALESIFRPFTQLVGEVEGSGLGLALVARMAALHGGSVVATSPGLGGGSRFSLYLPWWPEIPPEHDPDVAEPSETGLPARADGPRPRILVAEDNASTAEVLLDYLRAHRYHVELARDGVEVVERALAEQFDLVILDIDMPRSNGMEAARRIRESRPSLPLVALTALAMPGDREKGLRAGLDEYLTKPLPLLRLRQVIERLLITRRSTPG